MKVGDLVRGTKYGVAGKKGIILRVHTQEPTMQNDLLATVDVLWTTGQFQSYVKRKFLQVVKSS